MPDYEEFTYCKNSAVLSLVNNVGKNTNMKPIKKIATKCWFSCKNWKEHNDMYSQGG